MSDQRQPKARPIDVVIPVFNARDFTERCIASIYRHEGHQIGKVFVFDNASNRATRDFLDRLDYPRLEVHHADKNHGFAEAVNRGFRATASPKVLVLNSDVEARNEFLSDLVSGLESDSRLAAVTPLGNTFAGYSVHHCQSESGVVPTFTMRAFAFLVRREAFNEVGGFDPTFGLGYFEDADLSRKLVRAGWRLGVVKNVDLHHEIKGSFRELAEAESILARNRDLYLTRYPRAQRRVLVVAGSANTALSKFGAELETVLREGGSALWLGEEPDGVLPAIEVKVRSHTLRRVYRMLARRRERAARRPTEVWLARPGIAGFIVAWLARRLSVEVRTWQ